VSGIYENITTITRATNIKIKSNNNDFHVIMLSRLEDNIYENLAIGVTQLEFEHPQKHHLAIRALIGSELFCLTNSLKLIRHNY
jgi:hypothetical protein